MRGTRVKAQEGWRDPGGRSGTCMLLAVDTRFRFTVARTRSLCRVLAMALVRPTRGRSRLAVGTTSARSRATSSSLTGSASGKEGDLGPLPSGRAPQLPPRSALTCPLWAPLPPRWGEGTTCSGGSSSRGSTLWTEPLVHWHLLQRGLQALHVVPAGGRPVSPGPARWLRRARRRARSGCAHPTPAARRPARPHAS